MSETNLSQKMQLAVAAGRSSISVRPRSRTGQAPDARGASTRGCLLYRHWSGGLFRPKPPTQDCGYRHGRYLYCTFPVLLTHQSAAQSKLYSSHSHTLHFHMQPLFLSLHSYTVSRAVRGNLGLLHFRKQTAGSGDQTTDLLVNGQPSLPPCAKATALYSQWAAYHCSPPPSSHLSPFLLV